uniref:APOBEC-1 n=1 Tax=Protopterus annectens TaxID=7888 RepID=A0A0M3N0G8_PROAN|nr:APOBEC-1 [Protopterus annectens]
MVQKRTSASKTRMTKKVLLSEYQKFYYSPRTCIGYVIQYDEDNVIFQNWICNKRTTHAELQCIYEIKQNSLIKRFTPCTLKWYMSWTPCSECANEIIRFLNKFCQVKLEICAARIYFHKKKDNRRALRNLVKAGVKLTTMRWKDYKSMWRRFGTGEEIKKYEFFEKSSDHKSVNWRWTLKKILKEKDRDSDLENALSLLKI